MKRTELLKRIGTALSPDGTSDYLQEFDRDVAKLKESLKQKIQVKTLDDVNSQLKEFNKKIDFSSIESSVKKVEEGFNQKIVKIGELLDEELGSLRDLSAKQGEDSVANVSQVTANVGLLRKELTALIDEKKKEIESFTEQVTSLKKIGESVDKEILLVNKEIANVRAFGLSEESVRRAESSIFSSRIDQVRSDLLGRIESTHRGGNANRQINVKSSVMSKKYTDINFANSGGISWSASDDDINKRVNITASIIASGGGGSGTPGGSDTQIQFNDGGSFGGASVFTWNKNTSVVSLNGSQNITVADTNNSIGLTVTQNDVTNNPRAVTLVNAGTAATLFVDPNGTTSNSTSAGGAFLLENTGNKGAGMIIYSNASSVAGRLVNIRADHVGFDQDVVHIDNDGSLDALSITNSANGSNAISATNAGTDHTINAAYTGSTAQKGSGNFTSTNTGGTTVAITGSQSALGTLKVTHTGDGNDANSAGVSIQLDGAGTVAQGLFIDAPTSTLGKLLNIRNSGSDKLELAASGALTLNDAYTFPLADGSTNHVLTTNGAGVLVFASVAATGGSGITRTTSIITANTTGGTTADTDYVYFVEGGITFTLPTAISNKNLYTIKNGPASVLVATSAGQSIDGSPTALIQISNQALGFISNNSVWGVV